jgi:hypothetical protein
VIPPESYGEFVARVAREAIRDELAWRRKEGLPILVWQDGKVVDLNRPRRRRKPGRRKTVRKS